MEFSVLTTNMIKLALTDVETTGLNPDEHEIIEIGLVVFDSEAPFTIYDTLDIKVKPEHISSAEKEALAINGYNKEDWREAVSIEEAMTLYRTKTKDCMFMAHNVCFDYGFIQKYVKFHRHKLDLFGVAWTKIPHEKMSRWSLKEICGALQIEPESEIHRAINGAMKEREVYMTLMGGLGI